MPSLAEAANPIAMGASAGGVPRTGVWLFPDAPARTIVAAARRAEALDLDEFWLGDEGPARDPFALLAAAAVVTGRIRLGIAVTNPYLRHPASTAVAAMTLQELSGGRAILGIGPGGSIALDPLGIARERPLARTRDAVRIIRAVAAGHATDGYAPPAAAFTSRGLPIVVGARGENFNRFASEAADGVFIGGVPLPALGQVLEWARSIRPIPVSLYVNAAFDADLAERVRPRMVFALLDAPELFRQRLGVGRDQVVAAADRLAAGDPAPARALIDDERFDQLVLRGDPVVIGRQLAELAAIHRPASIGIALLASDPIAAIEPAAAVFAAMREVLV